MINHSAYRSLVCYLDLAGRYYQHSVPKNGGLNP